LDLAAVQRDIETLRLATKMDFAAVHKDIESLRLSMNADMELLRRDMLIRLGGVVIASVAAASTIMTLLSRLLLAHP
jgi:hypothetical protein